MFKKVILVFLISSNILFGDEVVFFSYLSEIPIESSLEYDRNVSFKTSFAKGEYIEESAKLKSNQDISAIEDFYSSLLPNLGYVEIKKNHYKRENQELKLEFSANKQHIKLIQIPLN